MSELHTHRKKAVALRYQPEIDAAPRVIAKGSGDTADRMIALAMEHGIPLQEDPSLVQILSKIEVDHEVPPELYRVVAEVLSLVYRLDAKAREHK